MWGNCGEESGGRSASKYPVFVCQFLWSLYIYQNFGSERALVRSISRGVNGSSFSSLSDFRPKL
jgi:hypothetical protein